MAGCNTTDIKPLHKTTHILTPSKARVIDGDTLEVSSSAQEKFQVRLQGIDAPERDQNDSYQSAVNLLRLTQKYDI